MQRPDLISWFHTFDQSGDLGSNFAHLRAVQQDVNGWHCVRDKLRKYLEDAHRDARDFFHSDLCLSLDPFGSQTPSFSYPNSMPEDAQLGFFGEAFCGIISSAIQIVGHLTWTVPVFLFRLHNAAGEHLHRLIYGDPVPPSIAGRTGSDFIALCLDGDRRVTAVLSGEAKCHTTFNLTHARAALEGLGEQGATPVSLGQLKRVLGDLPARLWGETVRSIESILMTRAAVSRYDLFVYIFENPKLVNYVSPRLPQATAQTTHGMKRPLQIVEVWIPDLGTLVETIYQELYTQEGVPGAAS